jgi:hypothetical protein
MLNAGIPKKPSQKNRLLFPARTYISKIFRPNRIANFLLLNKYPPISSDTPQAIPPIKVNAGEITMNKQAMKDAQIR